MKESMSTFEFYQFGLEHVFGISAINGSGTGDMLDHLAEQLYAKKKRQKMKYLELLLLVSPMLVNLL
jgi:predicted GTPase